MLHFLDMTKIEVEMKKRNKLNSENQSIAKRTKTEKSGIKACENHVNS